MLLTSFLALLPTAPDTVAIEATPTWSTPVAAEALANLTSEPLPLAPEEGAESKAADFSYTFIELGAAKFNVDDAGNSPEDEVDIYYARGSLGLFGFLYVFAGYQNQSLDYMDTSTDVISLGVGAHLPLTDNLDLVGELGWLYSDLSTDIANLDDSSNGYEALVGARWMPIHWDGGGLEINGGVSYLDLENRLASDDAQTGWQVGARVHFLKLFSVGAGYQLLGDDDAATLGVRLSL